MPVPNHLVPCSHANPCYSSSSHLISSIPRVICVRLAFVPFDSYMPTQPAAYATPGAPRHTPSVPKKGKEELKNKKELVEMERVWEEGFGFFHLASSVDAAWDQGAGIGVQQDLILRCLLFHLSLGIVSLLFSSLFCPAAVMDPLSCRLFPDAHVIYVMGTSIMTT